MIEQRRMGKIVIANIMVFMVLFNVSWVASLITHEMNLYVFFLLIIPYTLLFLTRVLCKINIVVVLLFALIAVLTFVSFIPLDAFLIIFTFMAGSLVYNFYAWKHGDFEPKLYIITFYTIIHLALMFGFLRFIPHSDAYQTRLVLLYILLIALFVLQMQVNNLDYRIILQQNKGGQLTVLKQLVKVNNFVGIMFILAVALFGVFSVFLPIHLIPRFVYWLTSFRPGFGFIPDWFNEDILGELDMEMTDEERDMAYAAGFRQLDDLRARLFMDIPLFLIIVNILFYSLLITAVTLFIIFFVRFIRKRAKIDKSTGTIEESVSGSLFDDLKALFPAFGGRLHPVRRAYAKKVNKHILSGTHIRNQDPTNVIADKIRNREDIDELTAEYEVIRYGRVVD